MSENYQLLRDQNKDLMEALMELNQTEYNAFKNAIIGAVTMKKLVKDSQQSA